jgi:O-antigen ligase
VIVFTITEQYQWYITAGMLLLMLAFVLRWARTGIFLPHTGLEIPLLLLLVTAGLATWIAVDQAIALLQLARMLAAVVLFYAVVQSDHRLRPWIVAGTLLIILGLAFYWPLQNDFSANIGKFPWIARLGVWINQHISTIPGPSIHANVAAGTLAPGLALSAGLIVWSGKRRSWSAVLPLLTGFILLAALLLTSSRGAWLAVATTGLLALLVLFQRKVFPTKLPLRVFWAAIILMAMLGITFLTLTGLWEPLLGQVPDPSGTVQSRIDLWRQSLLLIGDTPFTGQGLMGFRLVYAIYGILIQVPLQDHAHNTYLEVGLEQGLIGLGALLWGMTILLRWAWRAIERGNNSPWGWAGMAAISMLAIHGVFDVVYYVTRTLPLIGIFLGMAWMLTEASPTAAPTASRIRSFVPRPLAVVLGLGVVVLSMVIFHRPILSTWYANLGAITQNRLELKTYDASHFDNPTLDEVRQQLDLSPVIGYYEQSLHWQPANRTASQRLAQIFLSQGEYAQALSLIQAAWDTGHHDEITRLTLGDALVAQGDPQAATDLVRGWPRAVDRLNTQAWYRYYRQADYARATFAWLAVLGLDLTNISAVYGLLNIPQP